MARPIGIYEKATPKHFTWLERLNFAKELGFDFVELSIDESDERLARLDWSKKERLELVKAIFETGVRIPTITFSGHRRYPLGSNDPEKEVRALEMMEKCIEFAQDIGIRNIQLATMFTTKRSLLKHVHASLKIYVRPVLGLKKRKLSYQLKSWMILSSIRLKNI